MKLFTYLLCILWCITSYSQKVQIPDSNFEKALIDLKIDSDQTVNGYILQSDVILITDLDVSNKKIKSLKGIEAFTALRYLNCEKNLLSNLDITQNIGLTMVFTDVNNVIPKNQTKNLLMWVD